MGSLKDDLEKFLKTDGVRILIESGSVKIEPYEPLTEEDIDGLEEIDLGNMDQDALEALLDKLEDLQDTMEDEEPDDEDSEEYGQWEDNVSRIEDLLSAVQERLDDLEEEE